MTLPRAVAALMAALVAATALTLAAGPAGAEETETASPLTVTLSQLTPSTIPKKGRIVLAGTVRNSSTELWSAINVHPFLSRVPMTDRDQLTVAAASDPSLEVGTRLTEIGQFATIGDLLPGQTAPFRISLKVKDLPFTESTPGVYWIGVHALGDHTAGREVGGRARTFIPLVPDGAHTAVSLVVPLRERVRRDHLGQVLDTSDWSRLLGDNGRLERIAALLDTAGGLPATMLVDPAVIDAVGSIAADNPPLSLGQKSSQTPAPTPSPNPSGLVSPSRSDNRFGPQDRQHAARWLAQVGDAATWQRVLGLGYADPDTAALSRRRPQLIDLAAKESAAAFKRLGIDSAPAVAPPSGWLEDGALHSIPQDTTILVSDHAAPRTRTHWRTPERQDLVFTDEQAASGGPGPTPPLDALAVRQRIVSDAALRAIGGWSSPMVVELPANWDPGPDWQAADLFGGLNVPWLDLLPLDQAPRNTPVFDAALGYPASERRAEIGMANVSAARTLTSTASVMDELLRSTNDVKHGLTGIALEAVSLNARRDQLRARSQVLAANATMRGRLDEVSVVGTDFVTLSGGAGTITVTLVNQLDQPITVGIRPRVSSPDVKIQAPKALDLAPGQRTVLRLHAEASSIGVHEVTLTPVTAQGSELGTPLTFSLRTSQVGMLIWGVLIGGSVLLVVMILRRILRGVREHRWRGQ
ncbi:MAG TPA: DUF6049 family protein [Marmoricola sp.]|nr:DUF6049 family protein [Marmoricola sp.]